MAAVAATPKQHDWVYLPEELWLIIVRLLVVRHADAVALTALAGTCRVLRRIVRGYAPAALLCRPYRILEQSHWRVRMDVRPDDATWSTPGVETIPAPGSAIRSETWVRDSRSANCVLYVRILEPGEGYATSCVLEDGVLYFLVNMAGARASSGMLSLVTHSYGAKRRHRVWHPPEAPPNAYRIGLLKGRPCILDTRGRMWCWEPLEL
tara:strand:- start:164 stop:787 length:624 start_codon:yes stop_codon:yes gene_type:complete